METIIITNCFHLCSASPSPPLSPRLQGPQLQISPPADSPHLSLCISPPGVCVGGLIGVNPIHPRHLPPASAPGEHFPFLCPWGCGGMDRDLSLAQPLLSGALDLLGLGLSVALRCTLLLSSVTIVATLRACYGSLPSTCLSGYRPPALPASFHILTVILPHLSQPHVSTAIRANSGFRSPSLLSPLHCAAGHHGCPI